MNEMASAPCPAIVEYQDVSPRAPDGLRKIDVGFISGQPKQQENGPMLPLTTREIERRIHVHAVAIYGAILFCILATCNARRMHRSR